MQDTKILKIHRDTSFIKELDEEQIARSSDLSMRIDAEIIRFLKEEKEINLALVLTGLSMVLANAVGLNLPDASKERQMKVLSVFLADTMRLIEGLEKHRGEGHTTKVNVDGEEDADSLVQSFLAGRA